jgi:hypothetical protein
MGLFDMIGSFGAAAMSAQQAAKNRDFQERMTKNRYQFQMEDMRKAGLNPMLSMGLAPPGASAGAVGQVNPTLGMGGMGQDILDMKKSLAETRNLNANSAKTRAQTPKEELKGSWYERADRWLDDAWNSAKDYGTGANIKNQGNESTGKTWGNQFQQFE